MLRFPAGYGKVEKKLAWDTVQRRLMQSKQYWVSTTRPDGRPHVVPLDGIWVDDVWYFGGSPETVTQRNLNSNPHVVMHLPDPVEAVMVEGEARYTKPAPELVARLVEATREKYAEYGYDPSPEAYAEALGLFPQRVIAWTAFPTDATRFRFDEDP